MERVNPTPQYPGDSVRMQRLERRGELGDIRIQWYGNGCPSIGPWRVAAFIPGRDVFNPGDTPKVEPEADEWCDERAAADKQFIAYVARAIIDGWVLA